MSTTEEKTNVVKRQSLYGKPEKIPESFHAMLRVLRGKNASREYAITKEKMILGRCNNADIRIDDESMSRRHASILFRNMEFRIKDLDSTNGTLLNGSQVTEYAVRSGDKIMMGETIFQFNVIRA